MVCGCPLISSLPYQSPVKDGLWVSPIFPISCVPSFLRGVKTIEGYLPVRRITFAGVPFLASAFSPPFYSKKRKVLSNSYVQEQYHEPKLYKQHVLPNTENSLIQSNATKPSVFATRRYRVYKYMLDVSLLVSNISNSRIGSFSSISRFGSNTVLFGLVEISNWRKCRAGPKVPILARLRCRGRQRCNSDVRIALVFLSVTNLREVHYLHGSLHFSSHRNGRNNISTPKTKTSSYET